MGRMISVSSLLTTLKRERVSAIPSAQIGRVPVKAEVCVSMLGVRFSPIADGLMGLPGDPLTGLETFLVEYLGSTDHPRGRRASLSSSRS